MSQSTSDKATKLFALAFLGFLGYAITFGLLFIVFGVLKIDAWYGIYIPMISIVGVIPPLIFVNKKMFKSEDQ